MQVQDTTKLCECGCGQPAPIAKQTKTRRGHVKGQPVRFIAGHATRRTPHAYEIRDCGYETPCWVWVRHCFPSGHGETEFDGKNMKAHRAAWLRTRGPIPPGHDAHHLCENPPCVNPDHLTLLSHGEHTRLHSSKLTVDQVREIRRRLAAGERQDHLGAEYGVHPTTICDIKRGKRWKDVA